MSVHELKPKDKPKRSRAECTLLYELTKECEPTDLPLLDQLRQRNPERAREFLARLSKSMEVAA